MSSSNKFGVYVIRDNGAEDSSLPFFALSTTVAMRQFANTLRACPPSMRPDMQLLAIGLYDHSNHELTDSPEVVISSGIDDEIVKMLENDKKFYERVSVDELPVVEANK